MDKVHVMLYGSIAAIVAAYVAIGFTL